MALADGNLLLGRRLRVAPSPDRRLVWTGIGPRDGAGDPQWALGAISLSPQGNALAIQSVETFTDGFDMRVTILDLRGNRLSSHTDNSYPTTLYLGDDPAAPEPLRAEQASLDVDWGAWRLEDPEAPRPIVTGRFCDSAADGEIFHAGWTAAGHALINGRSRVEITGGPTAGHMTGLAAWWGVLGAFADGSWGWIIQGAGSPPAEYAALPRPPLALPVLVQNGQLDVDGVVQTDPALAAGVDAIDGPFS